jgi:hypothetical protein
MTETIEKRLERLEKSLTEKAGKDEVGTLNARADSLESACSSIGCDFNLLRDDLERVRQIEK